MYVLQADLQGVDAHRLPSPFFYLRQTIYISFLISGKDLTRMHRDCAPCCIANMLEIMSPPESAWPSGSSVASRNLT